MLRTDHSLSSGSHFLGHDCPFRRNARANFDNAIPSRQGLYSEKFYEIRDAEDDTEESRDSSRTTENHL